MRITKKDRVLLIALKSFSTSDASGRIVGREGEPLRPVLPGTAERLVNAGLAELKPKRIRKTE